MSNFSYTIIFATQSGNAQQFAEELEKDSKSKNIECKVLEAENVSSIDEFNNNKLIVFIFSTFGDGEPTDDAVDFTDMIKQDSFWEKLTNKELNYAIFGLGNTAFPKYNVMGKLLDEIFSKHMKSLCKIGLGDDSGNINDDFKKWKDEIFFPALDKFIKG